MKASTKQTYSIFWRHSRPYKFSIFLMISGMFGAVLADTYAPLLYKDFFDDLAGGNATVDNLTKIVVMIFAMHGAAWLFWRLATFFNNYFQPRVMSDLLNTCFEYMHRNSYSFFNNNFSGSLVKRVTRYTRAFEDIADQFYWHLGHAALKIAMVLVVLYFRFWPLAVILLLWAILYILFQHWFSAYKMKYDLQVADLDSQTGGHLSDTITNQINIKVFTSINRETAAHKDLTERLFQFRKWSWDLGAVAEAIQAAFIIGLEFIIFYLAIRYWRDGLLTIGDFALIQAYLLQIFHRLWDVGRYMRRIYERLADAQEMTQILMTPHEINDAAGASELKVAAGNIAFGNLTFGYYKKNEIFKNFNLSIKSGERVALIGPSGGGKTTIVKLLFRFFDIDNGEILIDGQNIAEVTQESLRANIALVPQEPILFHRSLIENIRYARPEATDEEVIKASKLAHCHEFINTFPEGYETFVGERGIKLSGGERQRVAIARAILKNAPILVLDEATSSLDSESEALIQDALKNLMIGKTTIVIAHRLSTIMQMDRIIVLQQGKILEEGTHDELLKLKQGTYQKLWGIQAGGFASRSDA